VIEISHQEEVSDNISMNPIETQEEKMTESTETTESQTIDGQYDMLQSKVAVDSLDEKTPIEVFEADAHLTVSDPSTELDENCPLKERNETLLKQVVSTLTIIDSE
jgi:uncharacterized membrane protein YfhO